MGSDATQVIPSLPAGQSTTLTIILEIDADFQGTGLVNKAEITADDGDDQDSDPNTGDTVDEDGDGVPAYVLDYVPTGAFYVVGCDCDDTNPAVFPGAIEICGGTDDNCNGLADEPGELG